MARATCACGARPIHASMVSSTKRTVVVLASLITACGSVGPAADATRASTDASSATPVATAPASASPVSTSPASVPAASASVSETPKPPGSSVAAKRIALGERLGCAVLVDGGLTCWGEAGPAPRRVTGVTDAADVAVGDDVVVLRRDGSASVFVAGDLATKPIAVPLGRKIISIGAAKKAICAVGDDRHVSCWPGGVAGEGGAPQKPKVARLERVVSVAVGAKACAVVESGRVSCFETDTSNAWTLPGVFGAVEATVGLRRVCARHLSDSWSILHSVTCFDFDNPARTALLSGFGAAAVTSAESVSDTPITCSGHNEKIACERRSTFGPLTMPPVKPGVPERTVTLPAGRKVVQLAAASRTACVLDDAGAVRCWGQNHGSLLGLPDAELRSDVPLDLRFE